MKNKLVFTVFVAVVAALLCAVIAQGNRIHELELVVGDCTQSWSEWAEDAREDNLRLQRLENATVNPNSNCCFDMGKAVNEIVEKWNRREAQP